MSVEDDKGYAASAQFDEDINNPNSGVGCSEGLNNPNATGTSEIDVSATTSVPMSY